MLSVDAQASQSRVRLTQEDHAVFTGRISSTVTLVKGQQMCINTTAILEVSINELLLCSFVYDLQYRFPKM